MKPSIKRTTIPVTAICICTATWILRRRFNTWMKRICLLSTRLRSIRRLTRRRRLAKRLNVQRPILLPLVRRRRTKRCFANIVTGEATDAELYLAFQALNYLLLQTPAAPLKNALVDAGIGKEVSGSFVKSIRQPVFSIEVTGTEADRKDSFIKTVYKTLQELTIKIDKSLIEATLNLLEFNCAKRISALIPKG